MSVYMMVAKNIPQVPLKLREAFLSMGIVDRIRTVEERPYSFRGLVET